MERVEWLRWRAEGIGSSDMPAIMGKCPYRTAYQVYCSKIDPSYESPDNFAMARGREWEPVARAYAEEEFGRKFNPVLKVLSEAPHCRASLDGLSDDNVILEIKIPGAKVFESVAKGVVPEHYMIQLQWQMFVANTPNGIFFCFNPETKATAWVHVKSDGEMFVDLAKAARSFWELVESKTPPDLVDGDFIDCNDPLYDLEARAYISAKRMLESAEGEIEKTKKALEARLGARPGVKGFGLMLSKYERKGSVQYKNVKELQGVDLEPYRGKSIKVFMVRES